MNHVIEVSNLQKSYNNVQAIEDISFYVEEGKLFAFLGPNGAGKSTTINIICTFLRPDGGNVTVNGYTLGKDDAAIRKCIGVVFQDGVLDDLLTVEENLRLRAGFYGLKGKACANAVKYAMQAVDIETLAKRQYGKLSGGQRRRCDIARALVNTPKILFLDEPTTGLDPQTRKAVWETIQNLQKVHGMTVFLTTHYMEEAANADYVIVIDNGAIAAKGTALELCEKYAKDRLTLCCADIDAVQNELSKKDVPFNTISSTVTVDLDRTLDALDLINACRPYITGFEVSAGSMDDAFLGITGKEIRE